MVGAGLAFGRPQGNSGMVSLLGAHLNSILYGLLFLVAAIGLVADRSLHNNLKRYDPSQWLALGSLELFKTIRVWGSNRAFHPQIPVRSRWRSFAVGAIRAYL
jgi:hypothetical protein